MRWSASAVAAAACGSACGSAPVEAPSNRGAATAGGDVVVLIAPRPGATSGPIELDGVLRFQPVVCSLHGKLVTGAPCAEAMPEHATVHTAGGPLAIDRVSTGFVDARFDASYAPPHGPACCDYNGCRGDTIAYTARDPHGSGSTRVDGQLPLVAVWPPGADARLDVTHAGDDVKLVRPPGPRRYALIGSADVVGDGARERVVYEVWANDFGVDVVDAAGGELYSFSCGNI
nr:hypothetical protein [Kofleriaceae bacterium]